MSTDPREALDAFHEAVREHYAASAHRTGDQDSRVEAAYMALADAFEIYEDAIYTAFDEVTPFELFDDVEDAKDDYDEFVLDDDDQDDCARRLLGLRSPAVSGDLVAHLGDLLGQVDIAAGDLGQLGGRAGRDQGAGDAAAPVECQRDIGRRHAQ